MTLSNYEMSYKFSTGCNIPYVIRTIIRFLKKEKNMSMQKKRRIFAFDRYANNIYIVFTNGREPTGVSDAGPNSETTKA